MGSALFLRVLPFSFVTTRFLRFQEHAFCDAKWMLLGHNSNSFAVQDYSFLIERCAVPMSEGNITSCLRAM